MTTTTDTAAAPSPVPGTPSPGFWQRDPSPSELRPPCGRVRVSPAVGEASCPPRDLGVLEQIARRVLWLAVRMVDAANRDRDTGDGVRVGGHQASCASLVPAMTALYFAHLGRSDKVSVKPHASPCSTRSSTCSAGWTAAISPGCGPAAGAVVPEPDPRPRPCGLLHGLARTGPRRPVVRRRHPPLRRRPLRPREPQPAHRAARRCGAGEGSVWEAVAEPPRLGWGTSSGSSTTTASPSTGSCRSPGTGNARRCSPPPVARVRGPIRPQAAARRSPSRTARRFAAGWTS